MKARSIILGVTLFAIAGAVQAPIKFVRTYKEGDADKFKMNIVATTAMGDANVSFDMLQTVKKTYENGDADIESSVSGMKIVFGGNEIPGGDDSPKVSTQRVSKYGAPIGEVKGGDEMMNRMNFGRYVAMVGDKEFKVGDVITIDSKNEKTGKQEAKGTIKLDSVTDGVAKLVSDLEVSSPDSDKPMKVKATSLMDIASSKPNKVEGTVTGLPSQQGMEIEKVEFTMERIKK